MTVYDCSASMSISCKPRSDATPRSSRALSFTSTHQPMINTRALVLASLLGTILQVAMVVAGHTNPSIAALFAVGGMGLSLLAGVAYAVIAGGGKAGSLAIGGLLAGAICALIGIFVSYMMGDVSMSLL